AKWAKRRPAAAALVAVSALAVLTLLVGGWWHNVHLRRANQTAEDRLYHSLVGEARALRQARGTGFRDKAFGLLHQAPRLETPEKALDRLRQEAVAALGDFVGLEPTTWEDFPANIFALAAHPDGEQVAVGLQDGTLMLRTLSTGKQTARLEKHPTQVDLR